MHHLSASQIETFDQCPRKWAWRKIGGVTSPPTASQALGVAVHEELERYHGGTSLDLTTEAGQIAMAGIHHFPAFPTRSEEEFEWLFRGHLFVGAKDLVARGFVGDHKTTSDFQWQKTPEELLSNVQAVLYAEHSFSTEPSPTVDLKWIYYRTKKPYRSAVTETTVTREGIAPTLDRIEGTANTIAAVRRLGIQPLDLPAITSHCDDFGGCQYKRLCNISPLKRLKNNMAQSEADKKREQFKAELEKKMAEIGGAGVALNPPAVAKVLSPNGDFEWDGAAWLPVPFAPPPPPPPPAATPPYPHSVAYPVDTPPPAAKRGPGRPPKVEESSQPPLAAFDEALAVFGIAFRRLVDAVK